MRLLLSILFLAQSLVSAEPPAEHANSDPGGLVSRWLHQMDQNRDGRISEAESTGLMKKFFKRNDTNNDDSLELQELVALAKRLNRNRNANVQRKQSSLSTQQMLSRVPSEVAAEADIAYRPGGSRAWRLDLFHPKAENERPRPGIVFVHGGAWRSGDKRAGTFLNGAIEYAQRGYVTITINYRLTGEAPFPACIEDVKCAVRWLRAHAEKYNLDPNRIGAYGNSAGAHLVSILGLVKPDAELEGDGPWLDYSSMVQAVAASATPADLSLFRSTQQSDERFKNEDHTVAELKRLCSPLNHVTKTAPPFLLFHGTTDRTVDVKHSDIFNAALKKAGGDVTYIRIEDSGHGVFNQHADRTKPAMEKFFARTLEILER